MVCLYWLNWVEGWAGCVAELGELAWVGGIGVIREIGAFNKHKGIDGVVELVKNTLGGLSGLHWVVLGWLELICVGPGCAACAELRWIWMDWAGLDWDALNGMG